MATSSEEGHTKLLRSHYHEVLRKDSFLLSKVIAIIDAKHPDVLNNLSHRFSTTPQRRVKMPIQLSHDLTEVQTIVSLREALQVAVNLEMTVMFEYLFACFSVLNSSDEVTAEDKVKNIAPYFSELRREYKSQFMIICIQEMQHMSKVVDMLISIGGRPDLQQVEFPTSIGVCDEEADLTRLNINSLFMFAKNEEPYMEDINPETAAVRTAEGEFAYYSIAQLYNAIEKGFKYVHSVIGDSMFSITPGMSNMKKTYTQLDDVIKDIDTIQEQGEGAKGGTLFEDIINATIKWDNSLVLEPGSDRDKLRKEIITTCNSILQADELIPILINVRKLITQINRMKGYGISFPIDGSILDSLKSIQPSHWGRFLMMIMNYILLGEYLNGVQSEVQIEAHFSRPSHPRPNELGYHPTTQILVDLSNSSFHLLLKLLEGTIIAVPPEMDTEYQISERYNNIRFYPIMSILIYPLGEVLSYFQLNKIGTNKTAGFPFAPNSGQKQINTPLEKFFDIIFTLKKVYDESLKLDESFFNSLDKCVGTWVGDSDQQSAIIKRVKYLLKNVKRSIDVLYKGFSNGIPLESKSAEQTPRKSIPPPQHEDKDKFYLNLEFDGYVIYSMATDSDPTYETRGFCGHHFMFEYNNDPDFTDEFHTQNTLKQGVNTFSRDFIPEKYYKGVTVKSATLVPPCYLSEQELIDIKFADIQAAISQDFGTNPIDFRFVSITLDNKTYDPKFSQLNYALTRQVGIDPVNVEFKTTSFDVTRANMLHDEDNKVIDYDTACVTSSQNFGKYPNIADDRMPKSGGYLAWAHPYHVNNGLLPFPNQIGKSGSGQSLPDIIRNWKRRSDKILEKITPIIEKYKDDPMVALIPTVLQYYPESKLICIALMVNITVAEDRNKLSYLCTRYLNVIELINTNGIASPVGCFYHVPLNSTAAEGLKSINNTTGSEHALSSIEFVTNQDWYLDFWVGGMDYDALTFFMAGSMMVPLFLNPPDP